MGTRAEYTYLNQSIDVSPKTITFSSLGTSDEGSTLPTFTQTPIVEVLRIYGDRLIYVSSISTTQIVFTASGAGDSLPISIDYRIVSRETIAPAAGAPGTAILWPYYCTIQDIQDRLVGIDTLFGTNGKLTDNVVMSLISQTHSEVNAALSTGNYTVPVTNTNKTTIASGISASDNVVTISVTDDTIFTIGDTVFIHGQLSSNFYAEFAHVVNADTGADTIVVYSLINSYNSGSTIEVVEAGFNYVRDCEAVGATVKALQSPVISQGRSRNESVNQFDAWYKERLDSLKSGKVSLDGLVENIVLTSYQVEEDTDPVFTETMKW
jgi:hypothetical protein